MSQAQSNIFIKLVEQKGFWLIFAVLLGLSVLLAPPPAYEWSQTTKLTIESDGQVYSGESSAHIAWHKNFVVELAFGFIGRRYQSDISATAVMLEIPNQPIIFALIQNRSTFYVHGEKRYELKENNRSYLNYNLAEDTFLTKGKSGQSADLEKIIAAIEDVAPETAEIPADLRPVLVYFTDINDPGTIQMIETDEQLSAVLGAPSTLRSFELTLDKRPYVENNLYTALPWQPHRTYPLYEAEAQKQIDDVNKIFKSLANPIANKIRAEHFALKVCMSGDCP